MENQFDDELDIEDQEDKVKLEIQNREKTANAQVIKRLRIIISKNENNLTWEDKAFLKARASYLTKGQRAEYADIIAGDYSHEAFAALNNPAKKSKVVDKKTPEEPTLEEKTRKELNEIATELGIGLPEQFPNKEELIAEIKKYQ